MQDTTPMNLGDILQAIGQHNWLALLLIVAVYLRTIFSEKSSFPVNIPPNWRPVFVGLAGGIVTDVTAMQSGMAWAPALLSGAIGLVVSGFFDGLLAAIFGSAASAPSWARAIVMVIDDLGGHPPAGGANLHFGVGRGSKSPPGMSPPPSAPRIAVGWRAPLRSGIWAGGLVLAVFVVGAAAPPQAAPGATRAALRAAASMGTLAASGQGCQNWQAVFPELAKIGDIVVIDLQAGKLPEQIEADVVSALCPAPAATLCVDGVVVLNDVVTWLLESGLLAKRHPELVPAAKALQAVQAAKLAARAHK